MDPLGLVDDGDLSSLYATTIVGICWCPCLGKNHSLAQWICNLSFGIIFYQPGCLLMDAVLLRLCTATNDPALGVVPPGGPKALIYSRCLLQGMVEMLQHLTSYHQLCTFFIIYFRFGHRKTAKQQQFTDCFTGKYYTITVLLLPYGNLQRPIIYRSYWMAALVPGSIIGLIKSLITLTCSGWAAYAWRTRVDPGRWHAHGGVPVFLKSSALRVQLDIEIWHGYDTYIYDYI